MQPLDVPLEDLLYHGGFGRLGFEVAPLRVEPVAEGHGAAVPFAAGGLAFHAGDHPLDDRRPLELGEHAEHLHHHPARRSRGVERLRRRAKQHVGLVELLEHVREPAHRPREPVDAVDEQQIEPLRLGLLQGALEAGPFEAGPGRLVGEAARDPPALLAVHVGGEPCRLGFERVGLVGLVGRDAGVGRDPHLTVSSPIAAAAKLLQPAAGDEVAVQHTQRTDHLRPLGLRAGDELRRSNAQPTVATAPQAADADAERRDAAKTRAVVTMAVIAASGPHGRSDALTCSVEVEHLRHVDLLTWLRSTAGRRQAAHAGGAAAVTSAASAEPPQAA